MTSTPPDSSPNNISTVSSGSGYPAVTKAINTGRSER